MFVFISVNHLYLWQNFDMLKEYLSGMCHYFSFEIYPVQYVLVLYKTIACPCYKVVVKEQSPAGSPEATVNY